MDYFVVGLDVEFDFFAGEGADSGVDRLVSIELLLWFVVIHILWMQPSWRGAGWYGY